MDSFLKVGDAIEVMQSLPERSVDLVFGSPPYVGKGKRYGKKMTNSWPLIDWVDWMVDVTREALRISKDYVFWVVDGRVHKDAYEPGPEGLVWKAYEAGLTLDRPVLWHKNAPPSRKKYFGHDWEYIVCFKRPIPMADRVYNWETIATPKKFKTGGHFRQRDANGKRRRGGDYPQNPLALPRDVLQVDEETAENCDPAISDLLRVLVGGGHMGSKLASEGEAPFPEKLPEPFIKVFTNPGDFVFDPFVGAGTVPAVAKRLGRRYGGVDIRKESIELSERRVRDVVVLKS